MPVQVDGERLLAPPLQSCVDPGDGGVGAKDLGGGEGVLHRGGRAEKLTKINIFGKIKGFRKDIAETIFLKKTYTVEGKLGKSKH